MKKGSKIKIILISILVFVLAVTGGFFMWARDTYKPVESQLVYDDNVMMENDNGYIVFKPKDVEASKGFIFYPGAKVEPESYSLLCSKIAEKGYLAVIAPMTLDLAILSPDKAEDVIKQYSSIKTWVIGGHSLGGVMAADYALKDDNIKGVVFYASYPKGEELKDSDLKVLSLYGSNDGVADLNKVKEAAIPPGSKIIEISGGNHAGFGCYGNQKGDNEADITNEEQIDEAASYTVEFLKTI